LPIRLKTTLFLCPSNNKPLPRVSLLINALLVVAIPVLILKPTELVTELMMPVVDCEFNSG